MAQSILNKIQNNELNRAQLCRLRENAIAASQKGNADADAIIRAIDAAGVVGSDRKLAFIGFCPAGDIDNRLDRKWVSEGICEFDFVESTHQLERFAEIMAGDTVILKKREQFGETMRLYNRGKVSEVVQRGRLLKVDWQADCREILVPLMGCNSTVDLKSINTVEQSVAEEFWRWLGWVGQV